MFELKLPKKMNQVQVGTELVDSNEFTENLKYKIHINEMVRKPIR